MVELVGGPFDGAEVRAQARLAFFWTNGRRCFRRPGRGRVLYRAMGEIGMGIVTRYRFVGHTHAMCTCGTIRRRLGRCRLCGSEAVVA